MARSAARATSSVSGLSVNCLELPLLTSGPLPAHVVRKEVLCMLAACMHAFSDTVRIQVLGMSSNYGLCRFLGIQIVYFWISALRPQSRVALLFLLAQVKSDIADSDLGRLSRDV